MVMGRGLPRQIAPMLSEDPRYPTNPSGMRQPIVQSAAPQSVAEILSQGSPGQPMPDLGGATSAASRQRQIADMLMQGAQQQDNRSIAGGLSQLGQAFLARRAGQKADTAEDKQREVASLLMQQAMQGGDQGRASLEQLLMQNPDAAVQYAMQTRQAAETNQREQARLAALQSIPGLTDQQRALIGQGVGVENAAEMAFALPPEPIAPGSAVGKLAADLRSGAITQEQYDIGIQQLMRAQNQVKIDLGGAAQSQYQGLPDGTYIEPPPGTSPLPKGQTWVVRNGQAAVEAVSGSEAEREAQGAAIAKTALDNTFDNIMQSYLDLQEKGAIRDTEATTGENISAFIQSSPAGRVVGKAIGSEAESLRETIEALQPSITQAIMSQPGMSARSMDSQRELEFFMKSITTPTADVWANFTTLHALDKRFGSGQLMNRMLQTGRITPEDYTRITRSPRVGTVINQMDRKIGELFTTDQQMQTNETAQRLKFNSATGEFE